MICFTGVPEPAWVPPASTASFLRYRHLFSEVAHGVWAFFDVHHHHRPSDYSLGQVVCPRPFCSAAFFAKKSQAAQQAE